jgi:hypothetical protein
MRLRLVIAVQSWKGENEVREMGLKLRGCEGGRVFDLFAVVLHQRLRGWASRAMIVK